MPFIAPAIALIAEGIAVIGTAWAAIGVVGQAVIMGGLLVASSYIVSALTPKPDTSDSTSVGAGVKFEREYGTNVSRQVACGLVGIAGHDTYINTYNPANKDVQQVFTFSDFYATALSRVAIGGKYVTLGAEGLLGFPVTSGSYANLIWIKFLNGRQTLSNDFLVAAANPAGRWTTDDIGIGISGVIVTLEYDKDNNNSFPDFFFEFQGAPLYDIRKDTTAGGSGSHRWNDQTTWEYSANPIVIEYNYRRGFSVNGDLFCGMGMPASDLPFTQWVSAMNICDEIDVHDGLKRYECSIILDCMVTHSSNLQAISLSCGSMQIDGVDGSWPLVGSNQTSVLTFTDDDIISVADRKYTAKRSMGELVNSVSGNFPDPDQLWSMVGYEAQVSSAYVIIDRRTRDLNIDFPQVRNSRQAAQLAWIYLYENRYEATATLTLRPRFGVLEAGDWVDWNSARYGLKTFIVVSKGLVSLYGAGPRNAVLTLQERDGQIYDGVTPPAIVVPTGNAGPVYSTEVDSFALVAVSVLGASGRQQPAIRVSWGTVTDVTVTDVEILYYPTAQPSATMHKIVRATNTVTVLSEGIVSNTNYTVQARIITEPSRATVFNAGGTVTTNNIAVSIVDFSAEIAYQITTLQDLFGADFDRFKAIVSQLQIEQNSRNWTDKREVLSQLNSRTDAANASISTLQTVMTTADTAIANEVHTVETNVAGNTASIITNAEAISTLNDAYAISSNIVSTSLGPYYSTVTTAATAFSTLNGYAAAQYAITLDVNGYAVGFNLFNGGGGISAATFTVAKFQVASPGVTGGAAVPIFTVGNVGGSPKVGIRADMFVDGTITATMIQANTITAGQIAANAITTTALAATSVTAAKMAAASITAANGAIDNLAVKSLNIGDAAVTVPHYGAQAAVVTGNSAYQSVVSFNLSVDTTGLTGKIITVFASAYVKPNWTVGNTSAVAFQLFINGSVVQSWSTVAGVTIVFGMLLAGADITASGGVMTIAVEVKYNGVPATTCTDASLFAMACKR